MNGREKMFLLKLSNTYLNVREDLNEVKGEFGEIE